MKLVLRIKLMKKVLLASLVAMPVLSFAAGPEHFAIPNNQYCDAYHGSEYSISISNISSTEEAQVTLHLYDVSGQEVYRAGTSNNGILSNITPGTAFVIPAGETKSYHAPYCTDQVVRGSIEATTSGNVLLGSGWISGRNGQNFRSGATILINNGQPF